MIYTYYQDEYKRLVTEIEDGLFDNLIEKYPELADNVEEYTNGEIDKKMLLKKVKNKFLDDIKYGQLDMSEQDIFDFEFKQKDLDNIEYKELDLLKEDTNSNNSKNKISPYELMKHYQDGDEKAFDDLFQWDQLKNQVKFTVPALEHMLKRCIRTNKSDGLENVRFEKSAKLTENTDKKCKGWIKRYVQPIEPEFIEGLFMQTLLEILKNKPSECPEDLKIIKAHEAKSGEYITTYVKLIVFNSEIDSDKAIYDELKRRMTTILTQTYTRTESKIEYTESANLGHDFDVGFVEVKPKKYVLSKYETSDIATTHTSDDDEYNLYLSDKQVAKDFMTTQLNIGYQDIYAYILSNIKGLDFAKNKFFIDSQLKYINFFKSCEGKYFKRNKHRCYALDIQETAKYFNCKESNVSQIVKGIAEKVLVYLDLDKDFGFKEDGNGGRALVRKKSVNKQHLTFKSLNIYSLKEKISSLRCKKHYNRTDLIRLSNTPIFKELIDPINDVNKDIFTDKMCLGGYPNTLVDIFDMYCNHLNNCNLHRLKALFFDAIYEDKLLATWKEYNEIVFALICCVNCYIDEMYLSISSDKIFKSERYIDYKFIGAGRITYAHDGYLDFGGERIESPKQLTRTAQRYILIDEIGYHIEWANYWERENNSLYFYKWVDNSPVWDDVLPIRRDNKDVDVVKYDLSDSWEILYKNYLPYSTQFLMDHINKIGYILPHRYRVHKNDKMIHAFSKAI